ncbi:hypothetical protein B4U79_10846 [Dinothrombium tinctorium]|uniref:ISXO2-like transposase domain-containing protein n=1 Tax=Dinothrombium tinctorium TaxID=1965070 RepID=A0A3S3NE98_9ACAR|nr:hypothetical protein B4U79_10846 [Dinothrombium tinctorium]
MHSNITQKELRSKCNIRSWETVSDWASFLRECPAVVLYNKTAGKIGGPNCVVEIKESHVRCRKYDVGRVLRSQSVWVLGDICKQTRECFVVPVQRRDAATLVSLIQQYVKPGSEICAVMGYTHYTVNHSSNFVNPANPNVHTQNVENMWKRLKKHCQKI